MSILAALIPVLSWVALNAAGGVLLRIPVRYRRYLFPAIVIPATASFLTMQHLSFPAGLSELWGSITLISLIHFSSLLYIKKWTLRIPRQTIKVSNVTGTWLNKRLWTHTYKAASNPRFIRIPYKHVILSDQSTGSQAKSTAIHGKFSSTRIQWLLVKIGIHLLLNRLAINLLLGPMSISDFAPAKTVLVRRLLRLGVHHSTDPVSMREIVMRLWVTMNGIWGPILMLDSIHTALALLFIYVLRIDIPEDWPDLFGSPSEAFNLGRFWTMYVYTRVYFRFKANEIRRFWHRLHLSGYSDFAHLIIPRFMQRHAVTKRVLVTFSLFLISGAIHQLTSWQLNPGCGDYADLQFFCMNAAAVISESALLHVTSPRQPSEVGQHRQTERSHPQGPLFAILAHLVGYTWIVGFFVWIIPKLYYPRVYCILTQ